MNNQVMVFIDYQNMATCGYDHFPQCAGLRQFSHINPIRLAELIVDRRKYPSDLVGIRVYRGRPSPNRQRGAAAVNDIQASRWERDPRVTVVRRQLRYPRDYPLVRPQEKGIDVALAVDFVRMAYEGAYDVGIIASHDTDLAPALETVYGLRLAHVEMSGWARRNGLWFPGAQLPWYHNLHERDYRAVCDDTDYLKDR
jgi:uncharacterized LabA/DUF88 family protein